MVEPQVIVSLGAVASQALLGRSFRVTKEHGKAFDWGGYAVVATFHPSATLRAADPEERVRLRRTLAEDLGNAHRLIP